MVDTAFNSGRSLFIATRNFAMTLKTHLLLLVVCAGLAPHAWAEEKANSQADSVAFSNAKPKAEKGDAAAQFYVGLCYRIGRGIPKDDAEAVKWYRKAAEQGNGDAQMFLADAYSNGLGVPKDEAEAVKWYRKAAEQGHAKAQYNLGASYAGNLGIPKDEAEAVKWYQKAAEQGHAKAQYGLSWNYFRGIGVPKDDVLAYKWMLLAGAKEANYRESIPVIEESLTPKQRAEGQKLAREFKPVAQK